MKTLIQRLFDVTPPRTTIRVLCEHVADLEKRVASEQANTRRAIRRGQDRERRLLRELSLVSKERDTARKQFAETRDQNHKNAAVHRLTEVQMHKLNVALGDAGLSHLFPVRDDQRAFFGLAEAPKPSLPEKHASTKTKGTP